MFGQKSKPSYRRISERGIHSASSSDWFGVRVERVDPCAPESAHSFRIGAHGVTRHTLSGSLFVTVLVQFCLWALAVPQFLHAGEQKPDTTNHWAFKPSLRPEEPKVKNKTWPRNAVDRFILARLEKEKLTPSPEADRATLIRRLSFDLVGLPPAPKEIEDFVADKSADAYEKLVERLL